MDTKLAPLALGLLRLNVLHDALQDLEEQLKANGIETVVLAATSPLPPGAFSEPSEPGRCVGCAGRVPHQLLR